jgi:tryptophan-rich sensory protein
LAIKYVCVIQNPADLSCYYHTVNRPALLPSGLIWSEVKQLWDVGLEEYANDMWNVIDFVTNSLYVATVALRVVAYHQVRPKLKT